MQRFYSLILVIEHITRIKTHHKILIDIYVYKSIYKYVYKLIYMCINRYICLLVNICDLKTNGPIKYTKNKVGINWSDFDNFSLRISGSQIPRFFRYSIDCYPSRQYAMNRIQGVKRRSGQLWNLWRPNSEIRAKWIK